MTEQEQYLACAELDGWKYEQNQMDGGSYGWVKDDCFPQIEPLDDYSTRDAVVAVIEKQQGIKVPFLNHLRNVVGENKPKNKVGQSLVSDFDLLVATPAQLREALLRATGKWKE